MARLLTIAISTENDDVESWKKSRKFVIEMNEKEASVKCPYMWVKRLHSLD